MLLQVFVCRGPLEYLSTILAVDRGLAVFGLEVLDDILDVVELVVAACLEENRFELVEWAGPEIPVAVVFG